MEIKTSARARELQVSRLVCAGIPYSAYENVLGHTDLSNAPMKESAAKFISRSRKKEVRTSDPSITAHELRFDLDLSQNSDCEVFQMPVDQYLIWVLTIPELKVSGPGSRLVQITATTSKVKGDQKPSAYLEITPTFRTPVWSQVVQRAMLTSQSHFGTVISLQFGGSQHIEIRSILRDTH